MHSADPDRDGAAPYLQLLQDFDAATDAAVQNPYLVAALQQIRPKLQYARSLVENDRTRMRASASEIEELCAAIIDGEPDLAAHAAHVHLYNSRKYTLAAAAARGLSS